MIEKPSYDDWLASIRVFGNQNGSPDIVAETGRNAWVGYYRDGVKPADAYRAYRGAQNARK